MNKEVIALDKIKGFKWRGMFTFLVVLALLVDAVSGVILYITPPGRIARWGNWTLWGLDKFDWQAIHTVFSFLLLLVVIGHLYFNWRVLVHFLWSKFQNALNLKWELVVACIIILAVFMGTLWNIQPFKGVMTLGQDLKLSWDEGKGSYSGYGRGRSAALDYRTRPDTRWGDQWGRRPTTLHRETAPFGQGRRGFGRRAWSRNAYTDPGHPDMRQQGLYERPYTMTRVDARETSRLKGRDIARMGKPETLIGTLARKGDEWTLKTDGVVYEIHMGPAEFRAQKGFTIAEGKEATVSGFLYGRDIAVTSMTTGGKSIVLRDETGRPLWSGTTYGRGRMNRL
jgi:hypothetical protein